MAALAEESKVSAKIEVSEATENYVSTRVKSQEVIATEHANIMAEGDKSNKRVMESEEGTIIKKIHLMIYCQDGSLVHLAIKRDVPMKKVLLKYCEKKHFEYSAVNFIYNGSRVQVRRTAEEHHMENGDVIDAMVHVHGGGGHQKGI